MLNASLFSNFAITFFTFFPCPKYCSLCEKQIKRDAKEKASKPPTYKTYQALKNSNFKVKEIDSLNKKF